MCKMVIGTPMRPASALFNWLTGVWSQFCCSFQDPASLESILGCCTDFSIYLSHKESYKTSFVEATSCVIGTQVYIFDPVCGSGLLSLNDKRSLILFGRM